MGALRTQSHTLATANQEQSTKLMENTLTSMLSELGLQRTETVGGGGCPPLKGYNVPETTEVDTLTHSHQDNRREELEDTRLRSLTRSG